MWPLDPDSMAAYYLEQSWYDEWDGLPEDESTDLGTIHSNHRTSITCKYCKEQGFHWQKTPNGWRLFDHMGMHFCKERTNVKQNSSQPPA